MHITHWNAVAVHAQGLFFSSGRKAFSDFTSRKLHRYIFNDQTAENL